MKTLRVLAVLGLALSLCLLPGCTSADKQASENVSKLPSSSLLYASYSYGQYTLYALSPDSLQVEQKIDLEKGWGSRIFQDPKGRIWCPVYYLPDMTAPDHVVDVVDPRMGTKTSVEVGNFPNAVFFTDKGAYVVCEEDGDNPTIYFVDSQMKVTKWKTVEHGGLLSGVQFDGQNFYFSSLHNDPQHDDSKDYPMLAKVTLNGSVVMQQLADHPVGFNNLQYANGHLYLGLQDNAGTLFDYDAKTLQKNRVLPYKDMVGEFLLPDSRTLVVSNFSKRNQSGSQVTLFDLSTGQELRHFSTKYLAEHLSFLNGRFYAVDNRNLQLEVLDDHGHSLQVLGHRPTQVTNLLWNP